MSPSRLPTVLHIEDDHFCGASVKTALEHDGKVTHVGWAKTIREGVEFCAKCQPDIVLLDLCLPDGYGFEAIESFSCGPQKPSVLVLTALMDDATLFHFMRSSAKGLIWKPACTTDTLHAALVAVTSGRGYVSPEFKSALARLRGDTNAFFKILSERELELLPLFGRGDTNQEIGRKKGIAPLTVKSHREHIMSKLGLHDTRMLMRWCAEKGFVGPKRTNA